MVLYWRECPWHSASGFGGRGKEILVGYPYCFFFYSLCLEHWWKNLFLNLKALLQPVLSDTFFDHLSPARLTGFFPVLPRSFNFLCSYFTLFCFRAHCLHVHLHSTSDWASSSGRLVFCFYSLGSQFHWPLQLEHCDSVFFCLCLCMTPGRY